MTCILERGITYILFSVACFFNIAKLSKLQGFFLQNLKKKYILTYDKYSQHSKVL